MTDYERDEELDRLLRAVRPDTFADDGWADSDSGDDAWAAIRAGTRSPESSRRSMRGLRRLRPLVRGPYGLGIGFAAVAATVIAIGLTFPDPAPRHSVAHGPGPRATSGGPPAVGPVPAQMELAGFDTCASMARALRSHAAEHVTAWGWADQRAYVRNDLSLPVRPTPVDAPASTNGAASAPSHSTTNDQEIGADEPDIVKTDGHRVVTVSGGVLRVVDANRHEITGTLDLRAYAGADGAQLLISGDRALVLLGAQYQSYPLAGAARPYVPQGAGSTYLLVDLAGAPRIVSTLHTQGGYVDARLIGGIARVVVASSPNVRFPNGYGEPGSELKQRDANRRIVEQAPISAWLPSYTTTTPGGETVQHQVPCDRVSHPKHYTGEAMVTVYSFDPGTSLDDPKPITIAADATTVYATARNLYVASSDGNRTQLHRFWVGDTGAPRYLGSGSVPGWLLNSYSISDYDGNLRVVTSSGSQPAASLYVLDADTLRRRGSVSGLGAGEQLHAVRFLGPLAYVVTFRSVDPLFVLDLSDPDHPAPAGVLTVSGYSDYLHPVESGRLLGVGQDVDDQDRVSGLQVSLFDVSHPSDPKRLDNVVRQHAPSETPLDPHAFLYWPQTRTAVIPIDSWDSRQSGAALVVRVGRDELSVVGTLRNPGSSATVGSDGGIERTLVIGRQVWTMSSSGLLVSDLGSLARRGWVAFA